MKWWRFDDETVVEMPKGPVGERSDHGVAAEKKVRSFGTDSIGVCTALQHVCSSTTIHEMSCCDLFLCQRKAEFHTSY